MSKTKAGDETSSDLSNWRFKCPLYTILPFFIAKFVPSVSFTAFKLL